MPPSREPRKPRWYLINYYRLGKREKIANRALFMAMKRDKTLNSADAPFFRVFRSDIRTFTIVRDAHCGECILYKYVTVIGETLIILKINASIP